MNPRPLARYLLAVTTALLIGTTSAFAGTVGGDIDPINTVSINDVANIDIVAGTGQTNTIITSGVIANNSELGWRLLVVSANQGTLRRTSGSGDNAASRITYTNVNFFATGAGTLGAGLTSPVGTHNIATGASYGDVAGTTSFNTGTAYHTLNVAAATTATVAYGYQLRISWSPNTAALSGTYTDTITLTMSDDSSS